jgi:hypothetical protein
MVDTEGCHSSYDRFGYDVGTIIHSTHPDFQDGGVNLKDLQDMDAYWLNTMHLHCQESMPGDECQESEIGRFGQSLRVSSL